MVNLQATRKDATESTIEKPIAPFDVGDEAEKPVIFKFASGG